MKLILYKIVMPFTVKDYEKGFTYTLAWVSRKETGNGSGVEVKESRPDNEFRLPDGSKPDRCHFTHKIYHCERFVSNWVRKLAFRLYGKNSLKMLENSWNCYPYLNTTSWNMEKPDKIEMTVQSMHFDNDYGRSSKPQYLSSSKLLKYKDSFRGTTVKLLDVTQQVKGLKELEITKRMSRKSGIGPLRISDKKGKWYDSYDGPVMCVYKLAKVRYDVTFGATLESKFVKQQEFMLNRIHKQMMALIDDWWPMTMQEVLQYEKEVNAQLGINLNRTDLNLGKSKFGNDDESSSCSGSSPAGSAGNSPDPAPSSTLKIDDEEPRPMPRHSIVTSQTGSDKAHAPYEAVKREEGSIQSHKILTPIISRPEEDETSGSSGMRKTKISLRIENNSKSLSAMSFTSDMDSFNTPNENLPPKCGSCSGRHHISEAHATKAR